ncbi:hypothetical protein CDD81_3021 [Ophiocordyceps australis]|uniref:RRM domain-containing protein n=1 Tax=Ophiocordyceps australis TaxID=1399860 RepID=A0A2C5YIX3_9HYPO|nr:hypothetical protein CDD81_3021 [Ophiocordyceps australis]
MAYAQPSASLPARPPPSNSTPSFQPASSHAQQQQAYGPPAPSLHNQYAATNASSSYRSYKPTSLSASQAVNASSLSSHHANRGQAPSNHHSAFSSHGSGYAQPAYPSNHSSYPIHPAANTLDSSEAAQIAEWQSAYNSATASTMTPLTAQMAKDGKSLLPPGLESRLSDHNSSTSATSASDTLDRKKTVSRQGGGKKWTDDTLLEWDPSHLRLFVGNLAGETTDESLLKAFSRWRSVQKARVIRDKRTTKSKGYGFVSFSDADDFFQAAKEMNGKYIQSHPVVVKKANTEIKIANVKDKSKAGKHKKHNKDSPAHSNGGTNNRSGNTHGAPTGANRGFESSMGPIGASYVMKPGQRTRNGLRLLG